MRARLISHDRRAAGRPADGVRKLCPGCAADCEFRERYAFDGTVVPAWVCDAPNCGYREIVRRPPAPSGPEKARARETMQASRDVRAKARRTIMKAKARKSVADAQIRSTTMRLRKAKPGR